MFGEPNTPGQEGVGLAGWCPVSWLSGCGARGYERSPGRRTNPPVHSWTGTPRPRLCFSLGCGVGGSCPLPAAHGALACVGITAFESVETGLGTALPDPRVPAGGPPVFDCSAVSGQSAFQVGSTSACPLPYAVYFLELTLVTSHVALATEQLLCR